MKKLMIMVAMVCAVAAAQAASWSWGTSGKASAKVWYDASGSVAANMTVYLIDAGQTSASKLLTDIRGGADISSYSKVGTATLDADGKLATTELTYGTAGTTYSFYMALVDGDNLFLSDTKADLVAQQSDSVTLSWSGMSTATTTKLDFDTAYSAGGWYATASVPEPTSGLLMLLGVAGLALRRRRA